MTDQQVSDLFDAYGRQVAGGEWAGYWPTPEEAKRMGEMYDRAAELNRKAHERQPGPPEDEMWGADIPRLPGIWGAGSVTAYIVMHPPQTWNGTAQAPERSISWVGYFLVAAIMAVVALIGMAAYGG
jgi:hypothetical protein